MTNSIFVNKALYPFHAISPFAPPRPFVLQS